MAEANGEKAALTIPLPGEAKPYSFLSPQFLLEPEAPLQPLLPESGRLGPAQPGKVPHLMLPLLVA